MSFWAAFSFKAFIFNFQILIVNIINCKRENPTKTFAFTSFLYNESSFASKIAVFKDLNVDKLGFDKKNLRWENWLTIWWGDLKTEVQIQNMQIYGIGIN